MVVITSGAFAEVIGNGSISRFAARMAWLKDLDSLREDAINAAKVSPTVQQQIACNFLMSPVSTKSLEELRKVKFEEFPDELASALRTVFAMPGTVACELANKATRKQQDRAQEHCKVAGERITPLCFC